MLRSSNPKHTRLVNGAFVLMQSNFALAALRRSLSIDIYFMLELLAEKII